MNPSESNEKRGGSPKELDQNELGRKGMEDRSGKKQYFPLLFPLRSKNVN